MRDYLKRIIELSALIYCKKVRIQGLWSSVTYPGVSYEERVQSTRDFNKHSDKIIKIIELEKEVEKMTKEMKERQNIVKEAAAKLENEEIARVITLRYIDLKNWEEIAKEIDKSTRWAMKLHSNGIKNLKKIIDFTSN